MNPLNHFGIQHRMIRKDLKSYNKAKPCPHCNGTGDGPEYECRWCQGTGKDYPEEDYT